MTYKSSSTFYRLGYSVTWNVVNSPLHFNKSVRFNIVLNTFLKGMLKYFRIKLVKWIGNVETNCFKLSLVIFDKTYPKYYKFRGKLKPMKFFSWNYLYFKKTSWLLGQLRDYYMKRRFKFKFKLGSGNYWHKFYTSIYFILNKNFKHARKMFKNGTIDAEFLGGLRSESSSILKLNNVLSFNVSKYSRSPHYQFMFKFYFKLYLYLNKWKFDHTLSFQEKKIKFSFFLKSVLLNFFLKKNIFLIKNKQLRRFQSRFVNSARTKYTLTKRILSHKLYYFNYRNYVKGPNYQWRSSGRVIKNYKRVLNYNSKIPWSLAFIRGYLFNISYKKIMRRNWIAANNLHNFLERMKSFNFLVKNYIVWKKNKSNLWIGKKDMFFNNNSVARSLNRLKGYYKKLQVNKKNNELSISRPQKISFFKNSKYRELIIKILFSNHYFFNEKENLYMNKYGFFKKSVKSGIVFYVRKKFKKFVFSSVFLKKKDLNLLLNKKKLEFFKKYYLKLKLLKNNNYVFSKNLVKVPEISEVILRKQTLNSFQKNLLAGIDNNPFDYLFNNFLFFFLFPNYDFLAKKKIKKKININNYLSAKFLFDKVQFAAGNNSLKNFKLLIFLKFYAELITLSNVLKKKIFVYKNELNVFLFRSFWSLEFFKVYYNFKFRRLNFEKLFKKSRNNVALLNRNAIKTYKKIQKKKINFFKKKKNKIRVNWLKFFFKNSKRIKYYFLRCVALRNKHIVKVDVTKTFDKSRNKNDNINILKNIVNEIEKNKKRNKNKNDIIVVYKKNILSFFNEHYLNKRLKVKENFFKHKIKVLLKKSWNFKVNKIFNFHKKGDWYLKIWKKQIRVYYSYKNKKLLYHKKFRYNYNTLIKNSRSFLHFNKFYVFTPLLKNYVKFIKNFYKKPHIWKRRILLKFVLYKKIFVFNYIYLLFNSFFKLSKIFLKKLFLLGFYALKKNIDLFFFVKQINIVFKKLFNQILFFSVFNRRLKVNQVILLKNKIFKKQLFFKKWFTKFMFLDKKILVYTNSLQRYTKAQIKNNREITHFLKSKYDDLKNYRLRKFSNKARLKFIKSLNLKKKGKYKKNFKAKSRNRYLGRVNYRKYKKLHNLELREELLKKNRMNAYQKKKKRIYTYFMIQKNLSKKILVDQPKMIFKNLYDAGFWFKQNKNNIMLSDVNQTRPLALLNNFNSFKITFFKKKVNNFFKTVNKDEIRNFLFYLDRFKKNKLSAVLWRISKKFYFSKFYLDNIAALRINKLYYNKKNSTITRSVVTQYSLNGKEHSNLQQYQFRYLKHLEKTAAVTNRIFSKHRINWIKDFFSYKDHFKIFKLIQKKVYYNIKMTQNKKIKKLKIHAAELLKKNKKKLFKIPFNLKFKNFDAAKQKKIILYYFKNLNYQLKEFIFFKVKNSKLNFFLQYFLKLNYFTYCNLKLKKNIVFVKTNRSSLFVNRNNDCYKVFDFNKLFLKKKNVYKLYNSWLKIFLWKFEFLKKNSLFNKMFNNLEILNSSVSNNYAVRKEKPWNVLFFGKFLKFFNEKVDFNQYFNLYDKSLLIKYEKLAFMIKFFQSFFFFFFIHNKNTKKLLQIKFNLKLIYKMKILSLINSQKNIRFFKNKLLIQYWYNFDNPLKFYVYMRAFTSFLAFKIQRVKNNYYFRKKMYTTRFWVKNKKFLFWMEQQFEKSFKMNVKLNYISAAKAISKFCRNNFNYYFLFSKRIHAYRFFQGWRQQSIYADVLWIVIISVKYYSAIFMSNMLSEQIVKRKKQWPFIKIIRTVIREVLPRNLMKDPKKVDGLRVLINGKINGRDRSTSYLIYKFYKDKQKSKIHQIYLKVDYSLSFANSKYGVFGIRVWISRI
jgi:hypothetical protein